MIHLTQYKLDPKDAIKHFDYSLKNTNTLSNSIMELVDFKTGIFFTLLPEKTNLSKINNFLCGGIAFGVRDHIARIILNKLHSNDKLSCIFDDATSTFSPGYEESLFKSCGLFYRKEIYYFITQDLVSIECIDQCFQASDAIWHSLCVLTTASLLNINKELSLDQIKNICLNAKLIIVGAYDEEGYIFWEKS